MARVTNHHGGPSVGMNLGFVYVEPQIMFDVGVNLCVGFSRESIDRGKSGTIDQFRSAQYSLHLSGLNEYPHISFDRLLRNCQWVAINQRYWRAAGFSAPLFAHAFKHLLNRVAAHGN